MTPDTKETCPANGNKGIVTKYSRDIEKCTKVITQKLDKVCAVVKEHGLAEELAEEPHNNNDGYFIGLSEDVWKRVYPAGERRVKWMEFAREWRDAYSERAVLYMERAGAHRDGRRWCRRCSVKHRGKDWDYDAEINDYSRAIENYMNTVRLQWGNHPGMSSGGEVFAEAVKSFLCSRSWHREPVESQSKIRSKSVQKENACICNLFSNYELCYPPCNHNDNSGIPTYLRRQYITDIVITLQSAYLCKAEACFEAKRYECAVEEYTKLIRLSPEESHISAWVYPAVYIDRARALLCLGRNDEAEADFEEALRIDPGVKEVKSSLFRLPEMTGT